MVLVLMRSDHHVDLAVWQNRLEILNRVLDLLAAPRLCLMYAAIDEDAEIVLASAWKTHQKAVADAEAVHADGRPSLSERRLRRGRLRFGVAFGGGRSRRLFFRHCGLLQTPRCIIANGSCCAPMKYAVWLVLSVSAPRKLS